MCDECLYGIYVRSEIREELRRRECVDGRIVLHTDLRRNVIAHVARDTLGSYGLHDTLEKREERNTERNKEEFDHHVFKMQGVRSIRINSSGSNLRHEKVKTVREERYECKQKNPTGVRLQKRK